MKCILIVCIIIGYIVGMFITKVIVTIHDNLVKPHNRLEDFDIVAIIAFPIFLPIILLYLLFITLYKAAEDVGDKITNKLFNNER